LFFARIDYQDYAVRSAAKTLEFVWRPTRSFGSATQIWTHSMWGTPPLSYTALQLQAAFIDIFVFFFFFFLTLSAEATYCFAPGTAFEWGDPPVQWDPRLFNVNIKQAPPPLLNLFMHKILCFVM
jgi:hypothetical protein